MTPISAHACAVIFAFRKIFDTSNQYLGGLNEALLEYFPKTPKRNAAAIKEVKNVGLLLCLQKYPNGNVLHEFDFKKAEEYPIPSKGQEGTPLTPKRNMPIYKHNIIDNSFAIIQDSNESCEKTLKEFRGQPEKDKIKNFIGKYHVDENFLSILRHWNKQGIKNHREPSPSDNLTNIVIKSAKYVWEHKCDFQKVKLAIDNYKYIVSHITNSRFLTWKGFVVGLDHFFELPATLQINFPKPPFNRPIKSWYRECLNNDNILFWTSIGTPPLPEEDKAGVEHIRRLYCGMHGTTVDKLEHAEQEAIIELYVKLKKFHTKYFTHNSWDKTWEFPIIRKVFFSVLKEKGYVSTAKQLAWSKGIWLMFIKYFNQKGIKINAN
jgi:hypothetical protein